MRESREKQIYPEQVKTFNMVNPFLCRSYLLLYLPESPEVSIHLLHLYARLNTIDCRLVVSDSSMPITRPNDGMTQVECSRLSRKTTDKDPAVNPSETLQLAL